MSLSLSQVTLRGGGPLLDCRMPRREDQPGEITILSTACVFAPAPGGPLVRFSGADMPERLLGSLRWTGQGSLVAPGVPICHVAGADGRSQAVDESSLSIAGLVRGEVGLPASRRATRPLAAFCIGRHPCNRPTRPASSLAQSPVPVALNNAILTDR